MRRLLGTIFAMAIAAVPLSVLSTEPPFPSPAATANPAAATFNDANAPIEITKFWSSAGSVAVPYYPYCLLCFRTTKFPQAHWNFVNHGTQPAKAIRFVVQEVSPFGDIENGLFQDLTGTFTPGTQIEGRSTVNAGLNGNGTHFAVHIAKVLWADGTIWSAGEPSPHEGSPTTVPPQVEPTPLPAQPAPAGSTE